MPEILLEDSRLHLPVERKKTYLKVANNSLHSMHAITSKATHGNGVILSSLR